MEDVGYLASGEPKQASSQGSAPQVNRGYRVLVRIRPSPCLDLRQPLAVEVVGDRGLRVSRSGHQESTDFRFDRVLGPSCDQADVFDAVEDVVVATVNGCCGTVLAYGQTGSGKTHTMTGEVCEVAAGSRAVKGPQRGIAPRALERLFTGLRGSGDSKCRPQWCANVSFLEIYNERVYDLLTACKVRRGTAGPSRDMARRHSEGDVSSLDLREGKDGVVSVPGLTVVEVRNLEQALEILRLGASNRTSGHNGVNPTSSRGHAIFQVCLERRSAIPQCSKLSLVDLAGSEKLQPIGSVSGVVLQELTCINLSLSALGQCISALVDSRRTHVPIRDSKLTRMLRDSFLGQAMTAMCVCISPTASSLDETLSSLKFADRAKRAVIMRRSSSSYKCPDRQVASLMVQVQELQGELSHERAERTRLEGLLRSRSSARDAGWGSPTTDDTASAASTKGTVGTAALEESERSESVGEDLEQYVTDIAGRVRGLSQQNEDLLTRLQVLEDANPMQRSEVVRLSGAAAFAAAAGRQSERQVQEISCNAKTSMLSSASSPWLENRIVSQPLYDKASEDEACSATSTTLLEKQELSEARRSSSSRLIAADLWSEFEDLLR